MADVPILRISCPRHHVPCVFSPLPVCRISPPRRRTAISPGSVTIVNIDSLDVGRTRLPLGRACSCLYNASISLQLPSRRAAYFAVFALKALLDVTKPHYNFEPSTSSFTYHSKTSVFFVPSTRRYRVLNILQNTVNSRT